MKKLLLIINEKAGTGHNGNSAFRLVKHFSSNGYAVTVFPIAEGIHAELKDVLTDTAYDSVVCIGGDGTLNHTVNELIRKDMHPVIGYIPAGTTNDFSQNLKLPRDTGKASEIITGGTALLYDVGKFNERFFLYVASFGAFSAVAYTTDQTFKNIFGYTAYVLTAIGSIPEQLSKKCHLRVELEDETLEGDYLFGAIANSLSVAGMKFAGMTSNELHDGKFELLLIKCPENLQELTETASALLRGDYNNPHIVLRRISSARIQADEKTEWTLDGEYGGKPGEIEFNIYPGGISIMVPEE